jgi:SagB-type dehydrogenase family enzyme
MDSEGVRSRIEAGRRFLRAEWELFEGIATDQSRGVAVPDQQKPLPEGARVVELPDPGSISLGSTPLLQALRGRRSRRKFGPGPLGLDELAFLLWATQGMEKLTPSHRQRTVPSAGARHSLETYLYLARVTGVEPGLWRYQPIEHAIVLLQEDRDLAARMDEALFQQYWKAAAVFVWTTVPYRTEWRYSVVSHKVIALDAGHVCQNLYLACEAIGCGTCALGAYDQEKLDGLLGVDGHDEFAIYAAPVGRKP